MKPTTRFLIVTMVSLRGLAWVLFYWILMFTSFIHRISIAIPELEPSRFSAPPVIGRAEHGDYEPKKNGPRRSVEVAAFYLQTADKQARINFHAMDQPSHFFSHQRMTTICKCHGDDESSFG